MKVIDTTRYWDSNGEIVMASIATVYLPTIWKLEKRGEYWVITDIVWGKATRSEPWPRNKKEENTNVKTYP